MFVTKTLVFLEAENKCMITWVRCLKHETTDPDDKFLEFYKTVLT